MLTIEERFMIKDLYRTGVSISEIARRTGHDRKTIRSLLQAPVVPVRPPRTRAAHKIDPYVPYLEQRLQAGVVNARKLYAEIRQQGYPGKETQVRDFVQPFRAARTPHATLRFETEPGEQAQVDWGHFGRIRHHDRMHALYGFVMTLGWSRTMYLEFTVSMDATAFLRCHLHAFAYFGGIPRQILHDNLKTAVLGRAADGTIHWQPRYLDFADYYRFSPRACQPYRPQTKGKVESSIRYVRGNFWPGLTFSTLVDLNQQGYTWLNGVANVRRHGTTGAAPFSRLPQEGLQSMLAQPRYDTSIVSTRRSSRDCLISYGGNVYSVPAAYALQPLTVKETEDGQLLVFSIDSTRIATHRLAEGRGQRIIAAAHYQGLPARTPAPSTSGAIQRLPSADLPDLSAPEVEVRSLRVYDQLVEEPR